MDDKSAAKRLWMVMQLLHEYVQECAPIKNDPNRARKIITAQQSLYSLLIELEGNNLQKDLYEPDL